MGDDRPFVAKNSGFSEWGTPPHIISAALETMGSIDLDPASNDVANETVGAERYYTAEDDGLALEWYGNVWLNPPYGRGEINKFAEKLLGELDSGRVDQATMIVNNGTETAWAQKLLERADAVCFPRGRTSFLRNGLPENKPLQGQVVYYFGSNGAQFIHAFSGIGVSAFLCRER